MSSAVICRLMCKEPAETHSCPGGLWDMNYRTAGIGGACHVICHVTCQVDDIVCTHFHDFCTLIESMQLSDP